MIALALTAWPRQPSKTSVALVFKEVQGGLCLCLAMQRASGPAFLCMQCSSLAKDSGAFLYPCGMKCSSCSGEEMDGSLPHLLRKQPQGAVHLHLSGRKGLRPGVIGANIYFVSKIGQRSVCVFVALNRQFYFIQRQDKIAQKAKESLHDKSLHLLLVMRIEKHKKATISRQNFVRKNLTRWCGRIEQNHMDNKYMYFYGCLKSRLVSEEGPQASNPEVDLGNH